VIKWKAIKYRHLESLRDLKSKIAKKELKDKDAVIFMLSLVAEWDFLDADTGQALPFDAPDELSIPQYKELCDTFNDQVGSKVIVPKTSALPPSSGRTASKARKRNSQSHPTGSA
jgi:hypothetical protein